MVTITHKDNLNKGNLSRFEGDGDLFGRKKHSDTIFFKNLRYFVISARVHPSEVASSYVLQGILRQVLKKNTNSTE